MILIGPVGPLEGCQIVVLTYVRVNLLMWLVKSLAPPGTIYWMLLLNVGGVFMCIALFREALKTVVDGAFFT